MDTAEKVKVFSSFDELTSEIIRDRETHDMLAQRYAVRFIMLNNFNEFKRLAMFMADLGVEALDLENLISEGEDDEWITKDTLKDAIKACKDSTFITPFSELVRFYNDDDFRGFFNEIMLLEDIHNSRKRIYVPLIGLQNRFTDFLNHFARIKESAPIWRYDAEAQSVEVFFAKYKAFTLPNGSVQCQLDSLREWLKFWKVQAPQERIVCTSMPIAAKYKYSKPDNIFNFTKIANAYEFMTRFLDLRFPFEYNDEDKHFWEEMLNHIDRSSLSTFLFKSFVPAYFNRVKFDASDIIAEWSDSNKTSFDRWLLINYVLHTDFGEEYPYVRLCVEATTNLNDEYELIKMIATRIVYGVPGNVREQYADERRRIIVDNHLTFDKVLARSDQEWLFNRTKEIFQESGDLHQAIDICTGVFDFEKKLLMGWYVYHPDNKRLQKAIEEFYPEYAAYLTTSIPSCFDTTNKWAVDYFKLYKQAKMEDKYLDSLSSVVKDRNASSSSFYQWYYSFTSSHDLLSELRSSSLYRPDKVYWIDGLGVEFLSYILYLIEQDNSNLKVVRSQITRSDLPTSTHHNRFDGDDVIKFGQLDELGHDSHGYKQFDTLRKELQVIKDIIQEIIASCRKEKCTVAIVSDHGLSCLSRKAPSKKYDGKFEHEGRYIKTSGDAISDSDYLVHQNDDEGQVYKVALTHSSLSKVPTHQVHGGCTPEEVLVPFILLSNKDVTSNVVAHKINLSEDDIMLSNPKVVLSVIPEPTGVELICEEKTYTMSRVGARWTAILEGITEGSHIIDVKPDGGASTELTINVIGVSGNMDIDDLFDL